MPRRASQNKLMNILFLMLGVLIIALIVVLIIMLATGNTTGTNAQDEQLKKSSRYVDGVSVAGVDVSGMSYAKALASEDIQAAAQEIIDGFTYTFSVNGTEYTYSAEELGITSDVELVLLDALYYGNEGDGEEIREQTAAALESGIDFPLAAYADEQAVLEKLSGYDYDSEFQETLVTLSDDLQGNAEAEYLEDCIGVTFTEGVDGVVVDKEALAALISANINSGDYSVAEAPAEITSAIDLETLRANTQRITSFTTSYDGSSASRSTNVEILTGIVNGVVIDPDEVWSINEEAGPRNAETAAIVGWKEEKGIVNGRYEMEYGGGVCQVSTTMYNAAIRAELTIVEKSPHSWPMHYADEGLDATISTGGKDLRISNPNPMPIYIVAYADTEEKTVTIDIYGPPLEHGYTIDFTSQIKEELPAPQTIYHYNETALPNGEAIAEGATEEWVKSKDGSVWYVWKYWLDEGGEVVDSELFDTVTYRAYQGISYVNGPNPAEGTPEATE